MTQSRLDRVAARVPSGFAPEFARWMCDPALGAHSKREVELKFFELLYHDTLDEVTVGSIARDLAIPRSRARTLLLEARTRRLADEDDTSRKGRVLRALCGWPDQKQVEVEGARLRFVIEDPHLRDLLKSYAYESHIVVDGSFAGEIISVSWASWARLVQTLVPKSQYEQVVKAFADAIKAEIAEDRERNELLLGDKKDPSWLQRAASGLAKQAPEVVARVTFEGMTLLMGA